MYNVFISHVIFCKLYLSKIKLENADYQDNLLGQLCLGYQFELHLLAKLLFADKHLLLLAHILRQTKNILKFYRGRNQINKNSPLHLRTYIAK